MAKYELTLKGEHGFAGAFFMPSDLWLSLMGVFQSVADEQERQKKINEVIEVNREIRRDCGPYGRARGPYERKVVIDLPGPIEDREIEGLKAIDVGIIALS
ncbi:MAG: hypothetical protein L6Q57_06320 [Alphaproteobacteria bacterium]|nr:hypothetical protein [Alphaproteobacteria bacterium]